MSNNDDAAAATAPVIKLPPFTTHSICAWFQRVETVFRLRNVTSTTRKADHVLSELPEETFDQIAPWLTSKGTTAVTYDEVKHELIKLCTPTPEERAKRLMNMIKLPIGEQRASAAYNEMWALATVPQADGSAAPLDLLRVIWLARLPHAVRSQIKDFTGMPLDDLKATADSIQGATSFPAEALAAPVSNEAHPPTDKISDEENAMAAEHTNYRRYRQPPRFQPSHKRILCYYHLTYGPRALKCVKPCSWTKNA